MNFNMKDERITLETAKLAWEVGFPIYVSSPNYVYDGGKLKKESFTHYCHSDYPDRFYPAPTQSLLQRWLREMMRAEVSIEKYPAEASDKGYDEWYYQVMIFQFQEESPNRNDGYSECYEAQTYEEALEIGLQESLKRLIK